MKLVPEHINEVHNFERKQDKMSSLGVGKKQLIISWLDEMKVTNYVINDDFTIDVKNDVNLFNRNLTKFPDYIQFNKIKGSFDCSETGLISLKGCPKYVEGSFFFNNNKLINLKGCPEYVGLSFWCEKNQLTSLEYCPKYVGYHFDCYDNNKVFEKEYILSLCKVVSEENIHNV